MKDTNERKVMRKKSKNKKWSVTFDSTQTILVSAETPAQAVRDALDAIFVPRGSHFSVREVAND